MTKEKLLEELKKLIKMEDKETAHMMADGLLLLYINDKRVADAFNDIWGE